MVRQSRLEQHCPLDDPRSHYDLRNTHRWRESARDYVGVGQSYVVSGFNTGNVGTVNSGGAITEYPLGFSPSQALDIKVGADKNLWMATDFNGIVRMTTAGGVTPFSLPDGHDAQPTALALGSDGNIWFPEANGPCFQGANFTNIGKITTGGVITEYRVGLHGNGFGIAAGPDHRIWFTDPGGCNVSP